ncbi:zinc finger protein 518A isoform X2 [Stigmatopora nigra]
MSSVDDVKDSPHLKEKARRRPGNQSRSPVKQHGFTRRHCKMQQGAVFSGNILSFGCSVCKDDSTYSPNDLLKHFHGSHRGILPTYPCDLCGFFTNEFAALQRHRIEHKNTLVTCELCCDGIQYSLLLLTRHYIMRHSLNGKFHCNWCEFMTVDAGTFVQHIHYHNESPWKCTHCQHVSLNEVDHQKHLKVHTLLHFICKICGYCATTMKHLKRHSICHKEDKLPHNQQVHTNVWKTLEHGAIASNSSQSCQNILKNICEQQEAKTVPPLIGIPGVTPNQNGQIKPEMCLEQPRENVDGTTLKRDYDNWNSLTLEQPSPLMLLENDGYSPKTNNNALTVLMVKNKISIPPNCTTKVMGFKVVDGKKHLVLKVIPVAKQNMCSHDNSSVCILDSCATSSEYFKDNDLDENQDQSSGKSATSHCFAAQPESGSFVPTEDIMAVKVKIEEEETLESPLHCGGSGAKYGYSVNGSLTSKADTLFSETNVCSPIDNQNSPSQTACNKFDLNSKSNLKKSSISLIGDNLSNVGVASFTLLSETLQTNSTSKNKMENYEINERATINIRKGLMTRNVDHLIQSSPETTHSAGIRYISDFKHGQENLALSEELDSTASYGEIDLRAKRSLNHKLFSFHNYSKDAFTISPRVVEESNVMTGINAPKEMNHISNFGLASSESSTPIEESECPNTDDENADSVLNDFNVVKVEEDLIPICNNLTDKSTLSSVGSFVARHSEAIITQLHKEKTELSCDDHDASSQQTKSIAQYLKFQDEQQNNRKTFALPMQIKDTPSFQLINNCTNPQINVSYMKSRFETKINPTDVSVLSNELKTATKGKQIFSGKMTTLVSSLQASASPHFPINSPKLKGSALISSSSLNNSIYKMSNKQRTCYLVPKSIPLVHRHTSPGHMQVGAKLPLNPRTVLSLPVGSVDKSSKLQTGRQTCLLRYVSPPKSRVFFNEHEVKPIPQSCHTREKNGNKVIYKIVSPAMNLLKSGSPFSNAQPSVFANSPATQCFLISSNKKAKLTNNLKMIIAQHEPTQNAVKSTPLLIKPSNVDRPQLAPRPIRLRSQRKLCKKILFDELRTTVHKSRRLSTKMQIEKCKSMFWNPVSKDIERTLRLVPYNCLQQIKCPRRYQPVVVLNHPDADIPEVTSIMKIIHRHRGAVAKVSLSQKTIQALAELGTLGGEFMTEDVLQQSNAPRPRAAQSSVQERFLLKLKLRKINKKKYEVVEPLSSSRLKTAMFDCWFCGRLFSNQEQWIGHGQRHLMEATRDWNKLF